MLGNIIDLTIIFYFAAFGALSFVVSIIALFAKGVDVAVDRWQSRQHSKAIAKLYKF